MEDLGLSWLAWLVSIVAAVAVPVGIILLVVGLLTYARRDAEHRGGGPVPQNGDTDGGAPEPGGDEDDGPDGEGDGGEGDDGGGRGRT